MSKGKHLTEQEKEYIKVNILIKKPKEIAEDLGRNYFTIFRYCQGLGIETKHKYTTQEDMFIKRMYYQDGISAEYIAGRLGLSVEDIYNRARKLGLKKSK